MFSVKGIDRAEELVSLDIGDVGQLPSGEIVIQAHVSWGVRLINLNNARETFPHDLEVRKLPEGTVIRLGTERSGLQVKRIHETKPVNVNGLSIGEFAILHSTGMPYWDGEIVWRVGDEMNSSVIFFKIGDQMARTEFGDNHSEIYKVNPLPSGHGIEITV